jgi:hypothetical protein
MQRVFSAVIFGITTLDWLFGLLCVNGARHTYPYLVSFVVTLTACFVVGLAAISHNRLALCLIQNGCVVLSFVLFVPAMLHVPGGDDGLGGCMAWIIGPTLLSVVVLAIVSTAFMVRDCSCTKTNRDDRPLMSRLAAVSLVASCLSVLTGPFIAPLGCLFGVVCGHFARRQARDHPDICGAETALACLIVGCVFLVIHVSLLAYLASTML